MLFRSYPGSGNYWTDLSSNGYRGTIGGSSPPTFDAASSSFVFNFNSANSSGGAISLNAQPIVDNFTIGSWIKTTNSGNDLAHYRLNYIASGELGGAANDFGFGVDKL